MTRVLVVDDEPQIVRALGINLRARHYDVFTAASRHPPDLVILDLGLPDMDGVEVIAGLRGWTTAPILVLSGRTGSADKVDALDAGADDYLTKPFGVDELFARLRATLRRQRKPGADTDGVVRFGSIAVDTAARLVTRDGVKVHLTPIEYKLLAVLVNNAGRVVTNPQLLLAVWGPSHADDSHYLRIYMGHLRHKLEDDPAQPRYFLTETAVGYRLMLPL